MKIKKIYLYDEPSVPQIDIKNLSKFLENFLKIKVDIRDNFFEGLETDHATDLARCRIFDVTRPFVPNIPTQKQVEFEKQTFRDSSIMNETVRVEDATKIEQVTMYDGFKIQEILSEIIQCRLDELHIIITNRLTCTYDENDYRYHARAVICANPAVISTTGIVEAPGKPKKYYIEALANKAAGLEISPIKEKYQKQFIDYNDSRISEVMKGYALQIIFYALTGNAFCEAKQCRLNNAHWQEDLIHSQINIGRLCNYHKEIIQDLL